MLWSVLMAENCGEDVLHNVTIDLYVTYMVYVAAQTTSRN